MKRKFSGILILSICILCTLGLTACIDANEVLGTIGIHFHKYETGWTSDEYSHWHKCLNSGCDGTGGNKSVHADNDEDGFCDVCDRDMTKTHSHDYQWVNNHDGTHKKHCSVEGCNQPDINEGPHDFSASDICVCGANEADQEHKHDLELMPELKATCTKDGNYEYYVCSICKNLFWDSDGKIQAEPDDVIIKAGGHIDEDEDGACDVCGNIDWNSESFNLITRSAGTYGYDYLGTIGMGEALQSLYRSIGQAAETMHEDVEKDYEADEAFATISFENLGLSQDDALIVWKTFLDDHPLYYWFKIAFSGSGSTLKLFVEDEYLQGDVRKECNQLIYQKIQEYLTVVEEETSAYQIALGLHDKIILSIDYAYSSPSVPETAKWAHSIVGVFDGRGAVCEGYAKSFQLLLNLRGIENIMVTGTATNNEGQSEGHAWNLIKLDDGEWYWCDLTWDDMGKYRWGVSYQYFCVNDLQAVNWADSGNITTDETGEGIGGSPELLKTFVDNHLPFSPTGSGMSFLYKLPTRSQKVYKGLDHELILRDTFTVGDFQYAIAGYGTVQVIKVSATGDVVIPESVTYRGVKYKVISMGPLGSDKRFGAGEIFGKNVTSVTIPNTIVYIWGLVFYSTNLTEITYKGTVAEWGRVEMQEFWKNDTDLTVHCVGGDVVETGSARRDDYQSK